MPVKLTPTSSPSQHEARIEVIPLIDIMFFLLAAFMLVSLSMVNLKSVKVNLPTATTSTADSQKKDIVSLSVDRSGALFLEREPVGPGELALQLAQMKQANENLRVFISGDSEARHGDIIRALDIVRGAGIERVAFEIRAEEPAAGTQ